MGCYAEYFWGRMTVSEGMLSVFVSSSWGNSVASGTIISKGWVSAVSVPDVATGPWSNGRCVCGCRSLSCSETSLMLSSLVFVYPSLESASPGESPHAIAETYGFSFALSSWPHPLHRAQQRFAQQVLEFHHRLRLIPGFALQSSSPCQFLNDLWQRLVSWGFLYHYYDKGEEGLVWTKYEVFILWASIPFNEIVWSSGKRY